MSPLTPSDEVGSEEEIVIFLNPLSLVRAEVVAGITVVSGNAPTSAAVYVGFVAALAHAGTVGSVSV